MIVNTTMQITTVLESRLLRYIDIFDKYRYFSISIYRFFSISQQPTRKDCSYLLPNLENGAKIGRGKV
jgi:hypothetical protein